MNIGLAYAHLVLRDVELRQLRALIAVTEEGSFGKAAERLGFTQSAISQQIAGLERAVGDKVFDRHGGPRRAQLTPTGELLLEHARKLLEQLQEAEDGLRTGAEGGLAHDFVDGQTGRRSRNRAAKHTHPKYRGFDCWRC